MVSPFLADFCLFKVNRRNTKQSYEIWSKFTIKIPEGCNRCRSEVFIVTVRSKGSCLLEFDRVM